MLSLEKLVGKGKRFVAITLLSASSIAATASGQSYSITDLGTLGGTVNIPAAVNKFGEVVGTSSSHPFLYANDEMIDLGTLDNGTYAHASGINDLTQVVGTSATTGSLHAFLWEDGKMMDLNSFFNSDSSFAYDINNSSQIICRVDWEAFRYDPDGTLTPLGTLGGSGAAPLSINEVGQIVGYSEISPDGPYHAFLYSEGTLID